MTTINPWINFNGNAQVAFNFYKSVFGGELWNRVDDRICCENLMYRFNVLLPRFG